MGGEGGVGGGQEGGERGAREVGAEEEGLVAGLVLGLVLVVRGGFVAEDSGTWYVWLVGGQQVEDAGLGFDGVGFVGEEAGVDGGGEGQDELRGVCEGDGVETVGLSGMETGDLLDCCFGIGENGSDDLLDLGEVWAVEVW